MHETQKQQALFTLNHIDNQAREAYQSSRWNKALEIWKEALPLFRKYANEEEQTFTPLLVRVLNDIANSLNNLGDSRSEFVYLEEAVEISRDFLKRTSLNISLSCLAMSLNNLSRCQNHLRKRVDALASSQEAVKIYRQLVTTCSNEFLSHLSLSLNNLSNCQNDLGQYQNALISIEEAVELCRILTQKHPHLFLPNLAMSLNNLSSCQNQLGEYDDALISIEETVESYRKLAKRNDKVFLRDLAMSLNNLSTLQSKLGKLEDASESIHRAVVIYNDLAKQNPSAFLPFLAGALSNLSNCESTLGNHQNAFESIKRAVTIYRQLDKEFIGLYTAELAGALNNLSAFQSELGKYEEALISIEDAVKVRRKLAKSYPDIFLPHLAESLSNLSNRQNNLGKLEIAMSNIKEAVSIYHQLSVKHNGLFTAELAVAQNNLSAIQNRMGQYGNAQVNIQEAVNAYRELSKTHPDRFLPQLAESLNNLSTYKWNLEEYRDALSIMMEVVNIRRNLVDAYSNTFSIDLANSLSNLSVYQDKLQQLDIALSNAEEAVRLYESVPLSSFEDGIRIYHHFASFQCRTANYREGVANWHKALNLVEKSRQLSFSLRISRKSIAQYSYIYDDLSNCQSLKLNNNYGALSTIESSKSRLLLDLSLAMDNDTALGKKRRNLQTELHVVRKQLDGNAIHSDEAKSIEDLRQEEQQLSRQLIALSEQIKQDNPDYKAFDSPLEAEQIVQLAQEQKCSLLTFRPTDQGTLIFLALPTGELKSYHNADFSNQMLNEFLLEHWLRPYYETFMQSYFQYQDGHIDEAEYRFQFAGWLDAVTIVSDRLYQELFAPIYADLQPYADAPLVLAPSRGLSILPLHAASYKKANDARRYLLDDFTVQYTPSFTFFQRLCERERQRSKIGEGLLVLDPLKDIHEIGYSQTDYAEQIFPSLREGSTGHLRHEAATEAAFLQRAPEATLLHLTCHGHYDMQYPLDSAFSFADNEKLSIGDLLTKLELPKAWHVTLSACETSLVELGQPADDHFGLASSFLLAGAPSVWGTLWSVEQGSTSEIIKQAYKYLFTENLSKAQALRKAQLEYKQKQSHPFYWAGLHHVGA